MWTYIEITNGHNTWKHVYTESKNNNGSLCSLCCVDMILSSIYVLHHIIFYMVGIISSSKNIWSLLYCCCFRQRNLNLNVKPFSRAMFQLKWNNTAQKSVDLVWKFSNTHTHIHKCCHYFKYILGNNMFRLREVFFSLQSVLIARRLVRVYVIFWRAAILFPKQNWYFFDSFFPHHQPFHM